MSEAMKDQLYRQWLERIQLEAIESGEFDRLGTARVVVARIVPRKRDA